MFSGSIVALVTPFTADSKIDYENVKTLVQWHIAAGTSAIVVAGTTGESPTLSADEKVLLAQAAVKASEGKIAILVGNGSNNTAASIALTKRLNDTGISGYLTVTPYYNKPTDAGLFAHYTAIAQATELPIILYNVPGRTLCDINNDLVIKLSELSNVVALKDATADLSRVRTLAEKCCQPFDLLSGDDATALEFCALGGQGVISVTANVAPKEMAEIYANLAAGQLDAAKTQDKKLSLLHKNLFIESSPMAVKWALYKLGQIKQAKLRLPLITLSEEGQTLIEHTLHDSKLYPQEF